MSKKKKFKEKETNIEDYYDLRKDSIDELVSALKNDSSDIYKPITTNIAEITGEKEKERGSKKSKEFDPYKRDKLQFLPTWLKALFIKWWFAGAVCFFIMWGTGLKDEDAILVVGVVWGLVVDLLVNPILRMLESDKKEYNNYMMFPFPLKAFWTFLTNIIYYIVVALLVNFCYLGVNELINLIRGTVNKYYIGVEPLLFGVFCTVADMAFIGIKDLIVYLVKRKKRKIEETENV
ncbi:MAG: hypothetical protein K2O81_06585 [Clostridia bacterium]|nr:hypothetical protein [Clostridia bacterium]